MPVAYFDEWKPLFHHENKYGSFINKQKYKQNIVIKREKLN